MPSDMPYAQHFQEVNSVTLMRILAMISLEGRYLVMKAMGLLIQLVDISKFYVKLKLSI